MKPGDKVLYQGQEYTYMGDTFNGVHAVIVQTWGMGSSSVVHCAHSELTVIAKATGGEVVARLGLGADFIRERLQTRIRRDQS